jgi:hypothetical protein
VDRIDQDLREALRFLVEAYVEDSQDTEGWTVGGPPNVTPLAIPALVSSWETVIRHLNHPRR